jgi:peptide deformylase
MTIRNIVSKSTMSLMPCSPVLDFSDPYIQQAIEDLIDTLANKQAEMDQIHPGAGGGVGLASNQIEYPFQPTSNNDPTPKKGYYPKSFAIPHMYVISIRPERASREKCETVAPMVCINASFTPSLNEDDLLLTEGCLSLIGIQGLNVPRSPSGVLTTYDPNGVQKSFHVDGFIARVHQHELDHCVGEEFLNKMNFTDADLITLSDWINQKNKGTIILKDRLICPDLEKVDIEAFKVWVDHQNRVNVH